MKYNGIVLGIGVLLSACVNEIPKEPIENPDTEEVQAERDDELVVEEEFDTERPWTHIKFTEFTLSINDLDVWYDNDDHFLEEESDTVYFNFAVGGDWMYDKTFEINADEYDDVRLFEQLEFNSSVTTDLSMEAPFRVLRGWRTYFSDWVEVRLDRDNMRFPKMEQKVEPKIEYSLDEYKQAVEDHQGVEWRMAIDTIARIENLPNDIINSHLYYKIVARNSRTGEVVTKVIVFAVPTTC